MTTMLTCGTEKLDLVIQGKINKFDKKHLRDILDHAIFNKSDVCFNSLRREFSLKLQRHSVTRRAKKNFLGLTFWDNSIKPNIPCVLIIKDAETIKIHDEDPDNLQRQEVISGGLIIKDSDNEIFIGSVCQHENPYWIIIKVGSINITIRDI